MPLSCLFFRWHVPEAGPQLRLTQRHIDAQVSAASSSCPFSLGAAHGQGTSQASGLQEKEKFFAVYKLH